jgi:hypothetical protein
MQGKALEREITCPKLRVPGEITGGDPNLSGNMKLAG